MQDKTTAVISDHIGLAKDFLARSKAYLDQGDLHQASEKGWGAAAHMVKAIAIFRNWDYESHDQFDLVVNNAREYFRQPDLRIWGRSAQILHRNYYLHPSLLDARFIGEDIQDVESFIGAVEPLISS